MPLEFRRMEPRAVEPRAPGDMEHRGMRNPFRDVFRQRTPIEGPKENPLMRLRESLQRTESGEKFSTRLKRAMWGGAKEIMPERAVDNLKPMLEKREELRKEGKLPGQYAARAADFALLPPKELRQTMWRLMSKPAREARVAELEAMKTALITEHGEERGAELFDIELKKYKWKIGIQATGEAVLAGLMFTPNAIIPGIGILGEAAGKGTVFLLRRGGVLPVERAVERVIERGAERGVERAVELGVERGVAATVERTGEHAVFTATSKTIEHKFKGQIDAFLDSFFRVLARTEIRGI